MENSNHHIVIDGKIVSIPFVRNIARVLVWSYVIFANLNSAEEQSPWLNIRISEPYQPHRKQEISPAVKIPICPTDE